MTEIMAVLSCNCYLDIIEVFILGFFFHQTTFKKLMGNTLDGLAITPMSLVWQLAYTKRLPYMTLYLLDLEKFSKNKIDYALKNQENEMCS